jgi:hypothetical protein
MGQHTRACQIYENFVVRARRAPIGKKNLQAALRVYWHLVISSSADHTLRTWYVRAGALVREHKGHQEPSINGAALGKGGEIVVSAGDDGTCLAFGTSAHCLSENLGLCVGQAQCVATANGNNRRTVVNVTPC